MLGDQQQVVETYNSLLGNLTAIGLKAQDIEYRLGRRLALDAAAERFTGEGAEAANALLSRPYREPFVVPQIG